MMSMEPPSIARRIVAIKALRNNLSHLENNIANLVDWAKSLPDGEIRNRLFDEISALDSIGDGIGRALDSMDDTEYFLSPRKG
jgi:hypothetical protein